MPTPLHNHSEYSALDGLSKPADIAQRCKDVGFESAACTDHGVVAGHIDFWDTLTEQGVKPILGIEAYQARENRRLQIRGDAHHLLLLAENDKGLRNLWAMNTEAHRSGFYFYARADWELLAALSDGVIATSACMSSLLSTSLLQEMKSDLSEERKAKLPEDPLEEPDKILDRYLNIFGERFYIEIHTYDDEQQALLNLGLVDLAQRRGLPLVYANDAHYAFPEQYPLHEAAITLGTGSKLSTKDRMSHPPCLYIMSEEEVRQKLLYLPEEVIGEALRNSDEIAERCNVSIPERRNRVPTFIPDKQYASSKDMLIELAYEGYTRKISKYGKDQSLYWPRFERELEVIVGADLVDYFLIVWDYVQWAKRHGMVGPGRGSVGGSLVAYLLGITQVDPIRYGLIFERFYNPGRAGSLPDIDTDFDPELRDKVKEYIADKYGQSYVADITTLSRMGAKAAVRDISRILEIPYTDTQKINEIIDETTDAGITADWEEIEDEVGVKLDPFRKQFPQLFEWAEDLYGYLRTYGVHASAVVIGDEPLDCCYPLRWASKMKRMVSQWDMHIAERLGYLKMDLLGLRNLTTLAETNRVLEDRGKPAIEYEALQYMDHPEAMWELLDNGYTTGIFQVESGQTARQIAADMKCRSVDDLAVLVAMNRPGPLRSGAFGKYIKGRNTGDWSVKHPLLQDVLEETYGVFVYQEQVIRFVQKIGYSLEEADEVRAIMGKKKVEKIDEEKERYLSRALDHMDEETALSIWRDMQDFAKYGFNKSHAIEYGIILLWTLAAKYYARHEFILAGMRTVDKEDKHLWVNEAMRFNMEILPPDINQSGIHTELLGESILYGLSDVKGMGESHSRWIVENRPYSSLDDFLTKTQDENRKYVLASGIKKVVVDRGRTQKLVELGVFSSLGVPPYREEDGERVYLTKDDRILIEEDLLGVALSDDTAQRFEAHRELIASQCIPLSEAKRQENGIFFVAGIIRDVRKRKTKNGKPFAFLKVGYETEELEFPVWNELLSRREQILTVRKPVLCKVEKNAKGIHAVDVRLLD